MGCRVNACKLGEYSVVLPTIFCCCFPLRFLLISCWDDEAVVSMVISELKSKDLGDRPRVETVQLLQCLEAN